MEHSGSVCPGALCKAVTSVSTVPSMVRGVVLMPEFQLGIQCLQYLLHCQAAGRFLMKRTSASTVKLVLYLLIFAAEPMK